MRVRCSRSGTPHQTAQPFLLSLSNDRPYQVALEHPFCLIHALHLLALGIAHLQRACSAGEADGSLELVYKRAPSVQTLHKSSFFNMAFLLISSVSCFSVGLLLSLVSIVHDLLHRKPSRTSQIYGRSCGEIVLITLSSTVHALLSVAGIVAFSYVPLSKGKVYWVDMAIRCNLHVLTGTNVRRPKQDLGAC